MNMDIPFHECLKHWSNVYPSDVETEEEKGRHISSEEIYRMVKPGGIENCPQGAVEHLSLCPVCLKKWAEWRRAVTTVENLEEDEISAQKKPSFLSYGLLKAAASEGPKGPLSLRSTCGRFTLNLLPQMDDPKKGMITLESVATEDDEPRKRNVTIRDAKGLVILDGKLRHGRLARRHENISNIDLNAWTIVLDEGE